MDRCHDNRGEETINGEPAGGSRPAPAAATPAPGAGEEPAPIPDDLRFDERGLVPVVVQEIGSGQVLMLAYANRDALARTLQEGRAWFFSRSRQRLWRKGESSGNELAVREVWIDCDADAVLYRVHAKGPACHTGRPTCFYRRIQGFGIPEPPAGPAVPAGDAGDAAQGGEAGVPHFLERLEAVIADRRRQPPAGSYTAALFEAGLPRILQKVGEEAVETVVAGGHQEPGRLVEEVADLVYHVTVLLVARDLRWADVAAELQRRAGRR